MEIERRWLIDAFPENLPLLHAYKMEQGYLVSAKTQPTVRVRATQKENETEYILCIKGEGVLAREEIETAIDENTYTRIKTFINKPFVTKEWKAYQLPCGNVLEVNLVDKNTPQAFMYAEVEFDSIEKAQAFVAPICLQEEKTQDATFSMRSYWHKTRCG